MAAVLVTKSVLDLDRAIDRIRECRSRILSVRVEATEALLKLGSELSTIHKVRLWRRRTDANGRQAYKSFAYFCQAELGISNSYAFELIDVSNKFDAKKVVEFGVSKFVYLLRAPKVAEATILRQIEAGASQREIKATLRAAKEKYGVVGKRRVTGRRIVGVPMSQSRCAAIARSACSPVLKPQPKPPTLSARQIVVRLPEELAEFLEREVAQLRKERPGSKVTASDVVRELIHAGMKRQAALRS